MKTTLDLPDELIHAVKLRAVVQRRTAKDLVAELLRQGLGMAPPVATAVPAADSTVEIGPQGLPVIRCRPNAPAKRMSAKQLLRLEQSAQTAEDLTRAGISVWYQRMAGSGISHASVPSACASAPAAGHAR